MGLREIVWWSLTLLMSVALWCALASVGGDFMEFRLMVSCPS